MEALFGAIIVFAVIFYAVSKKIKKRETQKPKSVSAYRPQAKPAVAEEPTNEPVHETPRLDFTVSVETDSHEVEILLAEGETVPMLKLGGYVGSSGGYVNYSAYKVTGVHEVTRRKRKAYYEVKDGEGAIALARADGLLEPYSVDLVPLEQDEHKNRYFIEEINSYGYVPPAGAVTEDLRDILNRIRYSNDIVSEIAVGKGKLVQRVRPTPSPSEDFALYADAIGIKFSKFVSGADLFSMTVYGADYREKAALFAYCVLCDYNGIEVENLRKSPLAEKIYSFADMAVVNESILKYIVARGAEDYMKPHKGSNAYKAVAEYFGL